MSQPRSGRSRAFIDPSVQGGLLRKLSFHWALLIVANCAVFGTWIWLFERSSVSAGEALERAAAQCLPFLLTSAALLPVFLYDALKLTARFAGPAHRLRSTMADAAAGRPVPSLKFRHDDFRQDMADDFNRLMARQARLTAQACPNPTVHAASPVHATAGSHATASGGDGTATAAQPVPTPPALTPPALTPGVQAADQAIDLLNSVPL